MKFFLTLIAPVVALANPNQSHQPLLLKDLNPSTVVDNVHIISGQYIKMEVDYTIPAPLPIEIKRSYCNSKYGDGFHILSFADAALFKDSNDHDCASCEDHWGSCYLFYGKEKCRNTTYGPSLSQGLTNLGYGFISGATNPLNTIVDLDKPNGVGDTINRYQPAEKLLSHHLYVIDGDGTKKVFQLKGSGIGNIHHSYEKTSDKSSPERVTQVKYELTAEITPNGNQFHYIVSPKPSPIIFNNLCNSIVSKNNKNQLLCSLQTTWEEDQQEKMAKLSVTTSDNKTLCYHYLIDDIANELFKKLIRVEIPTHLTEEYEYKTNLDKLGYDLTLVKLPNNRFIKISYFEKNKSYYFSSNQIKISKYHHCLNKVFQVIIPGNGKERVWKTFYYHPNDQQNGIYEGGYTDVWDAKQFLKRYHYDRSHKLTSIESFSIHKQLEKTETFFWDKNNHVNLVTKAVFDNNNQAKAAISFTYDKNHNPIEEKVYGCITGSSSNPLRIDKDGSVQSFEDKYVISKKFSDDGLNLLLLEEDAYQKKVSYGYYPNTNLLKSIFVWDRDQIKRRTFYQYDEDNVIVMTVEDDGSTKVMDDLSAVTIRKIKKVKPRKKQPALGEPEEISYYYLDLISSQEILLKKESFTYDQNHFLVKKQTFNGSDQLAYELITERDQYGNIIKKTDPIGNLTIHEYDANNNQIKTVFFNTDVSIESGFDDSNRKIFEKIHEINTSKTTYFHYDNKNQLTSKIDQNGYETNYEYDSDGNVIFIQYPQVLDQNDQAIRLKNEKQYDLFGNITLDKDPNGNSICKKYNIFGSEIEVLYPDNSKDKKFYYSNGLIKEEVTKSGLKICYQYDYQNRLIKKTTSDQSTNKQYIEENEYDAFHLLSTKDPNGIYKYYEYDFAGRLITEKSAIGAIKYEYDLLSRIAKKSFYTGGSLDYSIVKEYDNLDRTIHKKWLAPDNTIQKEISCSYDFFGNKCSITSHGSESEEQKIEYDYWKRPKKITHADGKITSFEYQTVHNSLNQRVDQTIQIDPDGLQTITTYDALYRPVKIEKYKNHLLSIEETAYDKNGNIIKRTQKSNDKNCFCILSFQYDSLNQKVYESYADLSKDAIITKYKYNNKGFLSTKIKADGVELRYTYDGYGNLLTQNSSDSSINYRYEYDLNQNMTRIYEKNNLVNERKYSENNKVIFEKIGELKLVKRYDYLGRITFISLPDSSIIDYHYDGIYLTRVIRPNQYTIEGFKYDQNGRLVSKPIVGTNYHVKSKYTKSGFCNGIDSYTYNEQISFNTSNLPILQKVQDPNQSYENNYQYDDLHQLQSENGLAHHQYQHDGMYNTLQIDDIQFAFNAANQRLSNLDTVTKYDQNGNLIYQKDSNGEIFYRYDALGRLIEYRSSVCHKYFSYDGFNRRIEEQTAHPDQENPSLFASLIGSKSPQATHLFLYDGLDEIGTVADSDIDTLKIIHPQNPNVALIIELQKAVYTPLQDYRFNIIAIIPFGKTHHEQTYYYSAFKPIKTKDYWGRDTARKCPWGYMSKRHIDSTNLIAFGFRDYNYDHQRWMVPDPVGFVDGLNLYAFVKNNPLQLSDIQGLKSRGNNLYNRLTHSDPGESSRKEIISRHKESTHPRVHLYFINGMLNPHKEAISHTNFLKNQGFQGTNLLYSAMGCDLAKDLEISLFNSLGIPTSAVHKILNLIKHFDKTARPLEKIGFITHSRGNMQLSIALDMIRTSSNPEINKLMNRIALILAVAPAKFITKEQFANVQHIVASSDPVTKLLPLSSSRNKAQKEGSVATIRSKGYNIHSLEHPVYEDFMSQYVVDLKKQYQLK